MDRANLNTVGQTWQQRLIAYAPYILVGAILIIVPPATGGWIQAMMAKALIYALLAMSLNLLWGYTGLWSLGHAAFFGTAGYAVAILTIRLDIENFWLVALVAILTATVIAAIFGVIALRLRGVYFLLITLALSQLLFAAAVKLYGITGGHSGLVGVPLPDLGFGLQLTPFSLYFFILVICFACYYLLYRIVKSPFGYALQGIRDDEHRMRHLGYNTWLYKYIAFVTSGLFAGIAGVLFVHLYRLMHPNIISVTTSVLAVLILIIGSDRAVFGPILGAIIVVFLEHLSSIFFPERWPLILGGVFIVVVMFLRRGVGIYLARLWNRVKMRYGYGSS